MELAKVKKQNSISQSKYFRIGDIIIYVIFILFFSFLGIKLLDKPQEKKLRAEIYVNNKLVYTQLLQKEYKKVFIETDIGGVDVEFKDFMVRAITSNSPKKIIVKEGWAKNSGDIRIGIPDKMYIKIIGEEGENLDGIAK